MREAAGTVHALVPENRGELGPRDHAAPTRAPLGRGAAPGRASNGFVSSPTDDAAYETVALTAENHASQRARRQANRTILSELGVTMTRSLGPASLLSPLVLSLSRFYFQGFVELETPGSREGALSRASSAAFPRISGPSPAFGASGPLSAGAPCGALATFSADPSVGS